MTKTLGSILPFILFTACVPPAVETTPEPAPAPEPGGEIPWAEGEAPSDAASTTREVGEEPRSQEIDIEEVKEDGIEQAGGSTRCTGKATGPLRAAVQERAGETSSCYEKIALNQEAKEGDVKISLRVEQDGSVDSTEVLSDSFGEADVTACIQEVLKAPFEEGPAGGCVVFVVPIHLSADSTKEVPTTSDSSAADKAAEK